jgi:hypothetical protein
MDNTSELVCLAQKSRICYEIGTASISNGDFDFPWAYDAVHALQAKPLRLPPTLVIRRTSEESIVPR